MPKKITYKPIQSDPANNILIVEYSAGKQKVELNLGYPHDDSDLDSYISKRAPVEQFTERKPTRTREDVLAMKGTVKVSDEKPAQDASVFTLSEM